MSHYTLDARRLLCPLPVIRTQNKVKELAPGDTLAVICTDPGAQADIPAWCRVHGHTVLEIREQDHELIILIQAGAA
ncbi:MAG: SirA family protein [Gammaproteobacteria bacterium RBG_16_57_12]|nr:MAG: SirA family protein [Gammaproteobacteria bacterium RBG_16_57_12]